MSVSIDLIHIGNRDDRKRAITAWLDVRGNYIRLPGDLFGVTGEHIRALEVADPPVTFTRATKEHANGQKTPVQP